MNRPYAPDMNETLSHILMDVDPISRNVQLMVLESRMMQEEQSLNPGESIQYFVALITEYLELLPAMHENQDPREHDAFMESIEESCLHMIERKWIDE